MTKLNLYSWNKKTYNNGRTIYVDNTKVELDCDMIDYLRQNHKTLELNNHIFFEGSHPKMEKRIYVCEILGNSLDLGTDENLSASSDATFVVDGCDEMEDVPELAQKVAKFFLETK